MKKVCSLMLSVFLIVTFSCIGSACRAEGDSSADYSARVTTAPTSKEIDEPYTITPDDLSSLLNGTLYLCAENGKLLSPKDAEVDIVEVNLPDDPTRNEFAITKDANGIAQVHSAVIIINAQTVSNFKNENPNVESLSIDCSGKLSIVGTPTQTQTRKDVADTATDVQGDKGHTNHETANQGSDKVLDNTQEVFTMKASELYEAAQKAQGGFVCLKKEQNDLTVADDMIVIQRDNLQAGNHIVLKNDVVSSDITLVPVTSEQIRGVVTKEKNIQVRVNKSGVTTVSRENTTREDASKTPIWLTVLIIIFGGILFIGGTILLSKLWNR